MLNPFMTLDHCARFAVRKAFHTGVPQHVVATYVSFAPYTVIDDVRLLARDDVEPGDIVFTADPFEDDALPSARIVPLRRPEPADR